MLKKSNEKDLKITASVGILRILNKISIKEIEFIEGKGSSSGFNLIRQSIGSILFSGGGLRQHGRQFHMPADFIKEPI